jgi:hypothetical protein
MQRNAQTKTGGTTTIEAAKTVTICVLAATLAAAVGAIVYMWKHAALGREVRRTVLGALERSGSAVKGGVVSGGAMRTPLPINAAVHATVSALIDAAATSNLAAPSAAAAGPSSRPPLGAPDDTDSDDEMFAKLRREREEGIDAPRSRRTKRGAEEEVLGDGGEGGRGEHPRRSRSAAPRSDGGFARESAAVARTGSTGTLAYAAAEPAAAESEFGSGDEGDESAGGSESAKHHKKTEPLGNGKDERHASRRHRDAKIVPTYDPDEFTPEEIRRSRSKTHQV